MSTQKRSRTEELDKALRAIVAAIAAQSPVIRESGMVNVWLDVTLLDAGRAALAMKEGEA